MTRDASTLEELLANGAGGVRRGCYICAAPAEAQVQVRLWRTSDRQSTSATRSFCAEHAAAIYADVLAVVDPRVQS